MTNRPARSVRRDERRARIAAAQAEKERLERERQRKRRRNWILTGVVVLAVLVTITIIDVYVVRSAHRHDRAASAAAAPAVSGGPPWAVPADASAAVAAAGLPMLGAEGTALHIHAHLDVYVNGSKVTVPAEIGIDEQRQKISPLHTHDTTGVIHVESPTQRSFTLGEFFKEWGVPLTATQLGGLPVGGTEELKAYVDGTPYAGDPASITLAAHQEIAIVYGTAAQQVNVPSSYTFAAGL